MLLNELEEIKKEFNHKNAQDKLLDAKRTANSGIKAIEEIADPVSKQNNQNYVLPRDLVIGDKVIVADLNEKATVEAFSKDGQKIFVAIGNLKSWTPISNIRLNETKQKEKVNKPRNINGIQSRATREAKYEFDMRGMTVDEGIMELDRYIDNAILLSIPSVTIIHGKGTGVLRKAVHDFLRHHKAIKTFRLGVFGEGENGVTIAELK